MALGFLFLIGRSSPFIAVSCRQHRGRDLLHCIAGLSTAVAGGRPAQDLNRAITVVSVQNIRPRGRLHLVGRGVIRVRVCAPRDVRVEQGEAAPRRDGRCRVPAARVVVRVHVVEDEVPAADVVVRRGERAGRGGRPGHGARTQASADRRIEGDVHPLAGVVLERPNRGREVNRDRGDAGDGVGQDEDGEVDVAVRVGDGSRGNRRPGVAVAVGDRGCGKARARGVGHLEDERVSREHRVRQGELEVVARDPDPDWIGRGADVLDEGRRSSLQEVPVHVQ